MDEYTLREIKSVGIDHTKLTEKQIYIIGETYKKAMKLAE